VLVGRLEAVVVHEVFDADPPAIRDAKAASLDRYREACTAYYARRWAEARAGFDAAVTACPEDHLAREFRRQCDALMAHDPGPEWTGLVQLSRK
jgi:hypothetical protein